MSRSISVGIDIGTHQTRVVIAEEIRVNGHIVPKVIGTGSAESRGLEHGFIKNPAEAVMSVRQAVNLAEKSAGVEIKRAFVGIGGIGLSSTTANGSVVITRADLEVTTLDISKALETAETAIPHTASLNKKIINTIPVEYKIDGKVVWGQVLGLKAEKLDVKTLFIMCLERHIQDLIKVVEDAGIEVIDVVASPIAASFVNLSKKQKKAGCVLANIGAETLSLVVFEDGTPISLEVFPLGSNDITNDIALGLKIPLEEAENIKLGSITSSSYPKKKLDEIISARMSDMFEMIEAHLKKINRNALLPAGVVLTGGGAGISGLKEFAQNELRLPSRIADIHFGDDKEPASGKGRDSAWSVAYGLTVIGFNAENQQGSVGLGQVEKIVEKGKRCMRAISRWLGQFLP